MAAGSGKASLELADVALQCGLDEKVVSVAGTPHSIRTGDVKRIVRLVETSNKLAVIACHVVALFPTQQPKS